MDNDNRKYYITCTCKGEYEEWVVDTLQEVFTTIKNKLKMDITGLDDFEIFYGNKIDTRNLLGRSIDNED